MALFGDLTLFWGFSDRSMVGFWGYIGRNCIEGSVILVVMTGSSMGEGCLRMRICGFLGSEGRLLW